MPADKPRNVCFVLHGHKWKAQPSDPFSNIISVQGAMGVGNVFNIELLNGAATIPGDYLYRAGNIMWDIESGMWGIFRIKDNDTNKENHEDKNNDNKDKDDDKDNEYTISK